MKLFCVVDNRPREFGGRYVISVHGNKAHAVAAMERLKGAAGDSYIFQYVRLETIKPKAADTILDLFAEEEFEED